MVILWYIILLTGLSQRSVYTFLGKNIFLFTIEVKFGFTFNQCTNISFSICVNLTITFFLFFIEIKFSFSKLLLLFNLTLFRIKIEIKFCLSSNNYWLIVFILKRFLLRILTFRFHCLIIRLFSQCKNRVIRITRLVWLVIYLYFRLWLVYLIFKLLALHFNLLNFVLCLINFKIVRESNIWSHIPLSFRWHTSKIATNSFTLTST